MTALWFLVVPLLASAAEAPDAQEILRRVSLLGAFDSATARLEMRIERSSGTRQRGLELYYRKVDSRNDVLVRVTSPAFLTNMKFLRLEPRLGFPELYLKNTQGVRRLIGDRGDEPLFDSDFRVGDLMKMEGGAARVLSEDALLWTVEVDSRPGQAWKKRVLRIRKADHLLLGFDELDDKGRSLRVFSVAEIGLADGQPYAKRSVVELPGKGQKTYLAVLEFEAGPKLPDSLFSRMNL